MTLETTYTGMGAAEPPDADRPRRSNVRPRRWWSHSGVWVLFTFAVIVVVGVLSSSASAAGGCGGG